MNGIDLLDCTLRDGGHLTKSFFGKDVIRDIVSKLVASRIDIVELGFLRDCEYDANYAQYNSIEEAKRVLPETNNTVAYSLLVQEDQYDDSKLEICDGTIEIIRVSFHDYDLEEGLAFVHRIVKKGYKVFVNPINLLGYTDEQIIEIVKRVNSISPYGFTIVDTFGSMLKRDLVRLVSLIDHNLSPNITLAVHLHENQALSYSLAQAFVELKPACRNICIDGSLYGMGRVPGNLCIELIMEYMNRTHDTGYLMDSIYDAIDDYIVDIKKNIPWGYSSAYALSAQHHVHRTFAEYLLDKKTLKTKQINQILSMIAPDRKTRWDRQYIEQLYTEYQNQSIDDSIDIQQLKNAIAGKQFLLIAPGESVDRYKDKINEMVNSGEYISFTVNHLREDIQPQYAFFSSFKRWENFARWDSPARKIITSNLISSNLPADYIVNYSDYAFEKNGLFDNCGVMLMKLLSSLSDERIFLAGFDGEKAETAHMISNEENPNYSPSSRGNEKISSYIHAAGDRVVFVTPSLYQKY